MQRRDGGGDVVEEVDVDDGDVRLEIDVIKRILELDLPSCAGFGFPVFVGCTIGV